MDPAPALKLYVDRLANPRPDRAEVARRAAWEIRRAYEAMGLPHPPAVVKLLAWLDEDAK